MSNETEKTQEQQIPDYLRGIYNYNKGKTFSEDHKKKLSDSLLGNKSPLANKNIFEFKNLDTLEEFIGNPADFRMKYNYDRRQVHALISGKLKSYKGWISLGILKFEE